ncbi:GUN4-like [Trichodesmium erythraeum IMS101]|uniref:GUN4-like n=1 Tax=Trichodesmium erythraeum (strain IMS101) TaxID=203124 RepID=Q10XQ0_TRIEI|nr:GUN4 domain-containing protein [Trichodesmium sp. ALOHA_ZT_67]MDT9341272.1 GUN4 domain-containing protein [Trichodesmium erythraeum 21-75]
MLCPICGTEYLETVPESCSICEWNLTSESAFFATAEIYQKKEQAQLNWARKTWQMLQAKEHSSHHNHNSGLPNVAADKINDKQNYLAIQKQLDQIQAQLHQATIERLQLHSQLEWVLYHLEQLNSETLAQTLYRIDEKLHSIPTPEPPMSEVGINYNPLINLLAARKWRKADELTWELLLQATLREEEGWLHLADIENFPCTDLCTINWLWEYYSDGLFGLNTQQRIWESVSGQYEDFCDRLGWRDGENWKYYDELSFNLEAPEGHLPIIIWRRRACYGVGQMMAGETFLALRRRVTTCTGMTTD